MSLKPKVTEDIPFVLEPIQDRLVIRVHKVTETVTGVILPDSAQNSYQTPTGVVIFAGPDCKQAKPGDTIMCNGSLPVYKLTRGRHEFVTVRECDVIAILRTGDN